MWTIAHIYLNIVHNLNVAHLEIVPDNRKERTHARKRERFLGAAGRVIAHEGLGGLTMQALADELDCAVGTVYSYYPSKTALVGALQAQAVATLEASLRTARGSWDEFLEDRDIDEELMSLVYLEAFSAFYAAASVVLADEIELVGMLMTERRVDGSDGSDEVLAVLRRWLALPTALLDEACRLDVLEYGDDTGRALRWMCALRGVVSLERLSKVDRHLFRVNHHARELTFDLLVGWGADRADVEIAGSHVEELAALGPMAPPPEGPGFDV